jgi:hypothetical protein
MLHLSLKEPFYTSAMSVSNDSQDRLLPSDIFEEIYVAFANLLVTDPYIQSLLTDDNFVFDFLPFEQIKAVYTEPAVSTIPAGAPHIWLLINRMAFSPHASCAKLGEITCTLAYESPMLHESTYKLASYLSSKLAILVFPCKDRAVRVTSSAASFTYNVGKRSVAVQQDITLLFEISARL